MDGESNGGTQTQQQRQQEAQQQAPAQQEAQGKHAKPDAETACGVDTTAYEAQLAERDSRIAELEAQIAEAAKSAEAADGLRAEIAALKRQGEDERIEFNLMLAGCRNVKAARSVLEDHDGDVEALKAAEPWMFSDSSGKQIGKTGFPNAGTTTDADKQMKEWREIAGLADAK